MGIKSISRNITCITSTAGERNILCVLLLRLKCLTEEDWINILPVLFSRNCFNYSNYLWKIDICGHLIVINHCFSVHSNFTPFCLYLSDFIRRKSWLSVVRSLKSALHTDYLGCFIRWFWHDKPTFSQTPIWFTFYFNNKYHIWLQQILLGSLQ